MWKSVVRDEAGPTLEDEYTVGQVLGKGAFGVVRLAVSKAEGGMFACKSVSKGRLVGKEDVDDLRREVEVLHLVSPHPTIAGIKAVFEDRSSVHIVMEYCKGGELFERIVQRGSLSEAGAARFFKSMVEMVAHVHSLGVMHRDIKPENFLLTDETDGAELKACDFGLAAYVTRGGALADLVGSAYYVAPEVLRRNYGPEADVWSLGVVLYILLSGLPPFWGVNDREIFDSILKGDLDLESEPWPSVSDHAKELVRQMLSEDPAARPTTAAMLEHPWLRDQGVAPDAPLGSIVVDRLRNFAAMTRLKKAAILAAAQHLGDEEIAGLRELFKKYDANGDGQITVDELRQGVAQHGSELSESDLMQVLLDSDVNGNGTLDYEEWLAATLATRLLEREDLLHRAFTQLDKDGNGTLCADEVAAALGGQLGMSEGELRALIGQHDTNGDGVIDWPEFLAMLRGNNTQLQRAATSLRRGSLAAAP